MLLMRSAVVHIALLAVETISAESFHIRRYKVAFTESLDFTAKFIHNTHHLIPDGDARHSPWYAAVLDMQVTCADAAHGHTDDSIRRLQNHRLWLSTNSNLSLSIYVYAFIIYSKNGSIVANNSDFCTTHDSSSLPIEAR